MLSLVGPSARSFRQIFRRARHQPGVQVGMLPGFERTSGLLLLCLPAFVRFCTMTRTYPTFHWASMNPFKSRLLATAFSLLGLAVSGCSSLPTPFKPSHSSTSGTLVIIRPASATKDAIATKSSRVYYSIDGRVIAALAPGQHVTLRLPAGEQTVHAMTIRGNMLLQPTIDAQDVSVTVNPASPAYAAHRPGLHEWRIEAVPAEAGANMVKISKARPLLHTPLPLNNFLALAKSNGRMLPETEDRAHTETMAAVSYMATRLTSLSAKNLAGAVNLASTHYSVDHAQASQQSLKTSAGITWTMKVANGIATVESDSTSDTQSFTVKLDTVESNDGMSYMISGPEVRSRIGHAYRVSGSSVSTADGYKCLINLGVIACKE